MNENLTRTGKGGNHEFGFGQKPIYLSATAAEALGRIGTKDAESAILAAFPNLNSFEDYVFRVAEHSWLKGVHSSVLHFRMLEALDRMQSKDTGPLAEKIIESLPADKDRALLYELDSYEQLSARVINRSGRLNDVIESCLSVLGDTNATAVASLVKAVSHPPHAERHIRKHTAQARAAQVLSIVCKGKSYVPRIRTLLMHYHGAEPSETRSWCCFMLIRTLGRLDDQASIPLLIAMLENDPTETALGLNPPPAHLIYKGWRPFHRPAAAWALGQLKAEEALPVLIKSVENLENASSTREQAAMALGMIGSKECVNQMTAIAEDYPEVMTRRALLQSIRTLSDCN
jgi:HEAT repeat protein